MVGRLALPIYEGYLAHTVSCELSNCFLLFLVSFLFHKEISQLFYTLFAAPRLRNLLIDLESLIVLPLATQRFCALHSHTRSNSAARSGSQCIRRLILARFRHVENTLG